MLYWLEGAVIAVLLGLVFYPLRYAFGRSLSSYSSENYTKVTAIGGLIGAIAIAAFFAIGVIKLFLER